MANTYIHNMRAYLQFEEHGFFRKGLFVWSASEDEPALVTAANLYACSETVIKLERMRTIKPEPEFSGYGF